MLLWCNGTTLAGLGRLNYAKLTDNQYSSRTLSVNGQVERKLVRLPLSDSCRSKPARHAAVSVAGVGTGTPDSFARPRILNLVPFHSLHFTRHALPTLSSLQMESGLHLQDLHALTSELKSSASARDYKTEELCRVHREQERAFCKRGWRCFACWRNVGARVRLRSHAYYS